MTRFDDQYAPSIHTPSIHSVDGHVSFLLSGNCFYDDCLFSFPGRQMQSMRGVKLSATFPIAKVSILIVWTTHRHTTRPMLCCLRASETSMEVTAPDFHGFTPHLIDRACKSSSYDKCIPQTGLSYKLPFRASRPQELNLDSLADFCTLESVIGGCAGRPWLLLGHCRSR